MPTRQEYAVCIIRTTQTDDTVVPHFLLCSLLLFISQMLEISALDLTSGNLSLVRQNVAIRLFDFCLQILVCGSSHLNVSFVWCEPTEAYRVGNDLICREILDSTIEGSSEIVQLLVQVVDLFAYIIRVIP